MTTELATVEPHAIQAGGLNREQVELIKKTVAKDATDLELAMFLHQCNRTGLDPLARQIYFIKRQGKGTIQTGIDGYRLVADRTGKYAGNDDYEFDEPEGQPKWAKATVYKMVDGQRCPFTATARWSQYYPGDQQGWAWKKMPHLMLGKCAEALALRKAFPADLSGIYTFEEMAQANQLPPSGQTEEEAVREYEQQHVDVIAKAEGLTLIEGIVTELAVNKGIVWLSLVGCTLFASLDKPFGSKLLSAEKGWIVSAYCRITDKQTKGGDPIHEIHELKSCAQAEDLVPVLTESIEQVKKKRAKKAEDSLTIDAEDAKAFGEKGVF